MKTIYICLYICLFFFGCKKDDNPTASTAAATQILPLKAGNQWTFKVTNYNQAGVVTSTGTMTITVLRDSIIAGETWSVLSNSIATNLAVYTNRTDGLYAMSSGTPYLLAKYPGSVNDTYSGIQSSKKIMSTNISITVPKGTYSCYQYQTTSSVISTLVTNEYYSPGVGYVQFEGADIGTDGKVYRSTLYELVSCILN